MLTLTKWGIWLYLILLLFEGALRKWIFPGAAEALLIIRDPVLLLIYAFALGAGVVPRGVFIGIIAGLAMTSFLFSFLAGQTNLLVTMYGLRTNYLHLPLIWIMAEVLDREDVEKLGSFILLMAIPMTLLMVAQFRSPIGSFINRGVGGDDVGGQIYGALGRIRPPSFFSFITGPMVYFPLAAAFLFHQASTGRRLPWLLVAACGLAIIVAMPVSISRGAMITTGVVLLTFVLAMSRIGLLNASAVRFAGLTIIILIVLSFMPFFREARDVFMDRWNIAKAEAEGNAWGSLTTRVTSAFTEPFGFAAMAPFFGEGIGVGSNVGARLLAGRLGFLLAEDEWGKTFLELGPVLGGAFILFRIALTGHLAVVALGALKNHRDPLPILIVSACAPAVMMHQWAPPTLLGFAVVGSGLVLASLNYVEDDEEEEEDDEPEEDEDTANDHSQEGEEEDPHDDEHEESHDGMSEDEARRRRRMRGL